MRPCLLLALALALGWPQAAPAQTAPEASCPPVAQPLADERVRAGMRQAQDRGFLWRIGRDGRVSYLYGTVHAAKLDWMFPGPTVVRALRDSDTLALELDMLDPQIQRRLAAAMAPRPALRLPAALSQRLARAMAAECLDAQAMAGITPEMQAATLTVLAGRRDGLDPAWGIDGFLAGFGRGAGKTVVSLETPESQMAVLLAGNAAEMAQAVAAALDELDSGRTRPMLNRVAQMWAQGDHAALQSYEQWCECRRTDDEREFMARLLDDRNPALAEAIDRLHTGGARVFAAVGTLHMTGATGLPGLMARRGYEVRRLLPAP
jgi:uncharacterized protein YbaP (TraB family)